MNKYEFLSWLDNPDIKEKIQQIVAEPKKFPEPEEKFLTNDNELDNLRGENAAAMSYHDAFFTWIQIGLIPEGLKPKHEKLLKSFIDDYSKIEDYVSFDDTKNIIFYSERFKADVLSGKFTTKVFDYDFDIRGTLDGVISGQR